MRRLLLLTISLTITCLQLATAQPPASPGSASGWVRVALAGQASVEMPATVKDSPNSTAKMPVHLANSNQVVYMAITNQVDSTKSSHTDGELDDGELDRVYEATIKSLLGVDSTARVLRRTPFSVAGRRGLEVQADMPGQPGLGRTKYARVLYAHRIIYLLTWRETADHDATDEPGNRARFFNSLQVKAPAVPTAARRAERRVQGVLYVVALLAGLFFLVRRLLRPAKQ